MGKDELFLKSQQNRIDHATHVLVNINIPEPQHMVTLIAQILIALGILRDGIGLTVLRTINFNCNAFRLFGEINDLGANRNLATKMTLLQQAQLNP